MSIVTDKDSEIERLKKDPDRKSLVNNEFTQFELKSSAENLCKFLRHSRPYRKRRYYQ